MLKHLFTVVYIFSALLLATVPCCTAQNTTAQVPGHYTYEHAFEYDLDGNHFDVHENL